MTIRTGLIVYNYWDLDDEGCPTEENWGEYEFVTLPRQGEVIQAYQDRDFQDVEVIRIVHHALEHPVAHPELQTWHDAASVKIIANKGRPRQ